MIRRLAEADNLELGSACKAYILLIAEGQAETPELGEVLSGALSEFEKGGLKTWICGRGSSLSITCEA